MGLEEIKIFCYIKRNTVQKDTKLLKAVWSYRLKCRPDGTQIKYKVRLCANVSCK